MTTAAAAFVDTIHQTSFNRLGVDTDRPHLVRLYQDDAGHIHGTVVPPHHRIPDVSGYGVEASPAAWALLEALIAAEAQKHGATGERPIEVAA